MFWGACACNDEVFSECLSASARVMVKCLVSAWVRIVVMDVVVLVEIKEQ